MRSINLTFGYYFPGSSFVHKLDAEVKLVCTGMLLFLVNFLQSLTCIYFLVINCLILFSVSTIPGKFIVASVRPFIWLFVLTVLLHAFSVGQVEGSVLRMGPLYVSTAGMMEALVLGGRFLVVILFSVLLISTTSPQVLVKVIAKWMSPLEKVKVPVSEIGLMIMIALRFLPILQEETMRILEARRIRLAVLGKNSTGHKLRNIQELLLAIFTGVLRRSQELSLSMASRGYGAVPVRKWSYVRSGKSKIDIATVIVMLTGCLGLFLLDRYLLRVRFV